MRQKYEKFLNYTQSKKINDRNKIGWYKDSKNRYTSTDGRLLVVIRFPMFSKNIKDGTVIDSNGNELETGAYAKIWKTVCPKLDALLDCTRFNLNLSNLRMSGNIKNEKLPVPIEIFPGIFISSEYINLLIGEDWECSQYLPNSPVVFMAKYEAIMLVIMPIVIRQKENSEYISFVNFGKVVAVDDLFFNVYKDWLLE